MYRNTYASIDIENIEENVKKIKNKYNNYKYYFGVVKADCYGHSTNEVVKSIINGGCNYLAVATLEEALEIRKNILDIPILCLGVIPVEYLEICKNNNITISVNTLEYANELNVSNLKAHIKVNSGMNRLGISTKKELDDILNILAKKEIFVEGIYTHIYNADDKTDTLKQIEKLTNILADIDKKKIPIIHFAASEAIVKYEKPDFVNGCRLGIVMYGFTSDKSLDLKSTISLYSKVIQINNLKKGDKLGYNGRYVASKDEKIAVVCIGYADGIIRKNTGREVYINDKAYSIVGNVCMDMLFVKVDDSVKVNDTVVILKDIEHITKVADYLETIPYEVICSIGKRVPRIIKK